MSARDKDKYYWLKLDRGFFKRHDIAIIEDMPNGKDYVLFYLKLMLESIDHEGALRFSDTIPYNEQMLASVTKTNVDIVRTALRLFEELGMVEVFDDKTLFMTEAAKLLGSETYAAKRKRNQRSLDDGGDNVPRLSPVCPPLSPDCPLESESEKEKESEKDIRRGSSGIGAESPAISFFLDRINPYPSETSQSELLSFVETLGDDVVLHALHYALDEHKTGWSYIKAILRRYEKDGLRDIASVLESEQRREQTKGKKGEKKTNNIFAELLMEGAYDDE